MLQAPTNQDLGRGPTVPRCDLRNDRMIESMTAGEGAVRFQLNLLADAESEQLLLIQEGVARILRQREDSIGSVQPPHPRSSTQSSGHFSDRIEARSDPGPGPDSLEPATWARRHSKVNSSGSDSRERGRLRFRAESR